MTDIATPAGAVTESTQTVASDSTTPAPSAIAPSTETQPASTAPDLPPGWAKNAAGKWAWKGQVDGEEVELEHDRAEHFLRTKESGQRRWQEATRLREEAERRAAAIDDYIEGIKNPAGLRALAQELGMSPREVAEQMLADELEEERLTPDQRELRDLRARDQQRAREDQRRAEQQREQEVRQAEQEHREYLDSNFKASMARVPGIPQHEGAKNWIYQRIANLYVEHVRADKPAHIDDITMRALAEYRDISSGAFSDDDLLERVWANEALREKMRGRYLEAAKPTHPSKQAQPHPSHQQARDESGRFGEGRKVHMFDSAHPGEFSALLDRLQSGKG
jgi:hypothetical protein